jgi:lyso-ornithine lipid O-acyltransferase
LADVILRYFINLRLMLRITLFVFGLALLVPLIKITMPFKVHWAHRICMWVHRYSIWCFNLTIVQTNKPASQNNADPVMYVCNHISWIDISVIGSILSGCFVAKAELESWPIFGPLADLQRTIYIKREERLRANEQAETIANRLARGENIILFPEGTSGLGHVVLPFKSSLFAITDDLRLHNLRIQPVTLSYTHLNGLPLLRAQRALIAWVADMGFGSHAVQLLSQSSLRALVQFHPTLRRSDFSNRKTLSAACEAVISAGLQRANMGRVETSIAVSMPNRLS